MYRVRSVYDRVQNKLSERFTVEGKWARRSVSYRVRTQRTEALARQMKATYGMMVSPNAHGEPGQVYKMTPCYMILGLPTSQIRVGSGEAVSPWSVTGQGF